LRVLLISLLMCISW